MHEGVVPPAEQDEAVELGGAAVHPVLDVVRVEESRMRIARERAPVLVPNVQRAPHPGRDRARLATRAQGPAGRVLDDLDHHRGAGEPSRRLRGNADPAGVLDESAAAFELVLRDVEADLRGGTARSRTRALRQEALREDHQRVGARARRLRGDVGAGQVERREEPRAIVKVEPDQRVPKPEAGTGPGGSRSGRASGLGSWPRDHKSGWYCRCSVAAKCDGDYQTLKRAPIGMWSVCRAGAPRIVPQGEMGQLGA